MALDLVAANVRLALGLPPVDTACKGGIQDGLARCRNLMGSCFNHLDGLPPAPRPDVVLLKVNLNNVWNPRFGSVSLVERSPERAAELGEDHRRRAETLGRNSLVIRQQRDGKTNNPEAHDSGCPVFTKVGIQLVDIRGVIPELLEAGFRLENAHRLTRNWKPPVRLVLIFSKVAPQSVEFPWDLFKELVDTSFGQVDVWANDPDGRGNVVHTVNCGQRDQKETSLVLCFAAGDWEVKLVS